jgi:hypothetical protein
MILLGISRSTWEDIDMDVQKGVKVWTERDYWQVAVKAVMNLRVPLNEGSFSS